MKMPLPPDNTEVNNIVFISNDEHFDHSNDFLYDGLEKPNSEEDNKRDEKHDTSLKQMLQSFSQMIFKRLDQIESRLDNMKEHCQEIEDNVEMLSSIVRDDGYGNGSANVYCADDAGGSTVPFGTNITLITLNTEEDYRDGSWLGDDNNPEMRVRCHISPSDMFHVNTTCRTAEKMALTLLDYLFDREVQACSNISGAGKHKKKKLDPLMIYGIRCHLIHKFKIKPSDWIRIKQNLDSKCRTAFRRKKRGLPLSLQRKSGSSSGFELTSDSENSGVDGASHSEDLEFQTITGDVNENLYEAQIIRTEHGDIQILHATPEQIIQLKKLHLISDEQLLTTVENEEGNLEVASIDD